MILQLAAIVSPTSYIIREGHQIHGSLTAEPLYLYDIVIAYAWWDHKPHYMGCVEIYSPKREGPRVSNNLLAVAGIYFHAG